MHTKFIIGLLLLFPLANFADEIPPELQGKMFHEACKAEINTCRGYMLRLVLSFPARAKSFDSGVLHGAMWGLMRKEGDESLQKYMLSERYKKLRSISLNEMYSCFDSDALVLSERFIEWGNENPESLRQFYESALVDFFQDNYSCP